jgi:hypothetical protein
MIYRKNLPGWERLMRLGAALGFGLCAWLFREGTLGLIFAAGAAMTVLTSAFGFCPACAMVGRRIPDAGETKR